MKQKKKNNIIIEIIMWLLSIIVIYPLAMVLITSLKSAAESGDLNVQLPKKLMFGNYHTVFIDGKLLMSFINSSIITFCSVSLIIFLSSTLAYIIMRNKTKLNRIIHKILIFGIILPFAPLPTIKILQSLHIYGSYISIILVYTALYIPFSTMLFSSFIQTVPKEVDEAAVIDGCEGLQLFFRIVFPLLKPIIVTVAVLNFMWVWNDFQYTIYLINSSSKWTLPLSIYNFYGKYNRSWNLVCADMVMISLPVILIYLLAQKQIMSGMTAGSVKG
jgi:raffinose/stachyose/melibiose transport system permease protein